MTRSLDVVTGAFSFSGRHIAELLLERGRSVRTLSRRPADPEHPLAKRVAWAPFRFDDSLHDSLRGADTLYNTYWVRFERGETTFARAVENTGRLVTAAVMAGMRRVVHVSVANADPASPFPYYRGKAPNEALVRDSGLSFAIVRPTVVFGPDDILVNNVAWGLRHVPVFLVPGSGRSEVQPVSGVRRRPDRRRRGRRGRRRRARRGGRAALVVRGVRPADPQCGRRSCADRARTVLGGAHHGTFRRRAPARRRVTRDELESLRDGLLVSHERPLGRDRFDEWLDVHGPELGRAYTSELRRNFP